MKFPWFDDLAEAQARGFRVREVPENRFLVTPMEIKYEWDYEPEDPMGPESELHWRSALLDENGVGISFGLPKFQNAGEGNVEGVPSAVDRKVTESIANGTALFTSKEDGSLVIRSVIDGAVHFRTRGSHQLGDFEEPVMRLVEDKYPRLLDPEFYFFADLHMEYVSPTNQIVVRYDEPELVLVHARERLSYIFARADVLYGWSDLGSIAYRAKMRLVGTETFDVSDPTELKLVLDALEEDGKWGTEGIVVREPSGLMLKVKTTDYLRKHRLRFGMNYSTIAMFCEEKGHRDLESLKKDMFERGMDWELFADAEDWFWHYILLRQKGDDILEKGISLVADWEKTKPKDEREAKKQFAFSVKDLPQKDVFFLLRDGKEERAREKVSKRIVEDEYAEDSE